MTWYRFLQNNSGGYYTDPAETVYVEADGVRHANAVARLAGINFNAPFCDCCGPRWTKQSAKYPDTVDNPFDDFARYFHGDAVIVNGDGLTFKVRKAR